jgi:hypothetical protein
MTRAAPPSVLFLACLGLATMPACESGSGSVRPAPGVQRVDDADPGPVALLTADPDRPFTVVGRVRGMADARFEARINEARSAAEQALRRQGASVGADAVIIDEAFVMDLDGGAIDLPVGDLNDQRNLQRPGGAAYATRPVHRVVLVGRAVRWDSPAPAALDPAPASP